jgi:XapX domain-containing protein
MKPIVLAFALGFACRGFGILSPAPPLILGALLVMTMTIGYIAVDHWIASPARHVHDCGGPSGLTASQTVSRHPIRSTDQWGASIQSIRSGFAPTSSRAPGSRASLGILYR